MGENPPFHTPVIVLTHHWRRPLEMEGGSSDATKPPSRRGREERVVGLLRAADRFNPEAARARDPQFHRGDTMFDRSCGGFYRPECMPAARARPGGGPSPWRGKIGSCSPMSTSIDLPNRPIPGVVGGGTIPLDARVPQCFTASRAAAPPAGHHGSGRGSLGCRWHSAKVSMVSGGTSR